MNAKVLRLIGLVRDGFEIAAVEDATQGAVRVRLRRGRHLRALRFEHFEVPAVIHHCNPLGVAK